MVLADLRRCIAVRLGQFGDRGVLVLNTLLGCRHADLEQAGTKWSLSADERGTSGRTGLLGVTVGEQRAFPGDAVDVRSTATRHATMAGADIPYSDIVDHDDNDAWRL